MYLYNNTASDFFQYLLTKKQRLFVLRRCFKMIDINILKSDLILCDYFTLKKPTEQAGTAIILPSEEISLPNE